MKDEIHVLEMSAMAARTACLTHQSAETYSRKFGRGLNFSGRRGWATLAQLVEHSIRNRKVIGSSPMGGSI